MLASLPCPFCNTPAADLAVRHEGEGCCVACPTCGARGPTLAVDYGEPDGVAFAETSAWHDWGVRGGGVLLAVDDAAREEAV